MSSVTQGPLKLFADIKFKHLVSGEISLCALLGIIVSSEVQIALMTD